MHEFYLNFPEWDLIICAGAAQWQKGSTAWLLPFTCAETPELKLFLRFVPLCSLAIPDHSCGVLVLTVMMHLEIQPPLF